MTANEIKLKVEQYHDPALAKKEDSRVCQIWEDGEITLQKCGKLLWSSYLHSIQFPLEGLNIPMPEEYKNDSYAFVTKEQAEEIRNMMKKLIES